MVRKSLVASKLLVERIMSLSDALLSNDFVNIPLKRAIKD
jgi:hypothetical protein